MYGFQRLRDGHLWGGGGILATTHYNFISKWNSRGQRNYCVYSKLFFLHVCMGVEGHSNHGPPLVILNQQYPKMEMCLIACLESKHNLLVGLLRLVQELKESTNLKLLSGYCVYPPNALLYIHPS